MNLWRAIDIQEELAKHLRSQDITNLDTLGKAIKALRLAQGCQQRHKRLLPEETQRRGQIMLKSSSL